MQIEPIQVQQIIDLMKEIKYWLCHIGFVVSLLTAYIAYYTLFEKK